MARLILPTPLAERTGGRSDFELAAPSALSVLRELERLHPSLEGWILDESGALRQHVILFRNGDRATLDATLASTDELHVVQAISGGSMSPFPSGRELLIATRKGLIVLHYDPGSSESAVVHRAFPGQIVEYACYEPRSESYFAAVTHGQFGPHLYRTKDPAGDWEEVAGLRFPESETATVSQIWAVELGTEEGLLWAGVSPGALFVSRNDGASWELVRGLWDQPTRPEWEGGLGGLCLHSICPWPGQPERLAVGISSAGVWLTEDGGVSWSRGVRGLVPGYLPEEARQDTLMHCVHKMVRSSVNPATLYMQFHGGVYRSDDAGSSWNDIGIRNGLPAEFGFPIVVDPRQDDRAFVVPLVADVDRVPPDGRLRVYETQDRGGSWTAHTSGLPQKDSFATILRQAFCHDREEPLGLAFGTSGGQVFTHIDGDGNKDWRQVANGLATVVAVRPGR